VKTLNLDELAAVERTITIKGETHNVTEMTVGNFLDTSKEADELEKIKDPAKQLESTIRLIRRSVPTLTEETLRSMSFEKLFTVVKFIQGEMDKEMHDAATEGAGQEGDGKK